MMHPYLLVVNDPTLPSGTLRFIGKGNRILGEIVNIGLSRGELPGSDSAAGGQVDLKNNKGEVG